MKKKVVNIGKENLLQPPFYKKVYKVVAKIPSGKVATYGSVAKACGCPKGSRAVGNALHCNRNTSKVPCHRVVKNDFHLGGYAGGIDKKKNLLVSEGIIIDNYKIKNINDVFFDPSTELN
ncbi:MAG: hypothetical protein A2161_01610 [Candidatus Schekmanbacteria bacterium RBG_13_48_7]|uniref:Methylated-DNA-[protein]-cysteine S-methyltransferase DNA binding domain-containing protein n=1 Tax=Candidatus Schekmanbacteria bacterium RBG_13_48_7 TaxID=1817878 RepID=A0A1F7RR06_9BACT|nr:MAG: hypothetical protein A2161_01610 [Candidatus Schekmanbacteria bacterium RBG_13_48_7]